MPILHKATYRADLLYPPTGKAPDTREITFMLVKKPGVDPTPRYDTIAPHVPISLVPNGHGSAYHDHIVVNIA